ncbi:hypothetical protein FNV43_RR02850 [Rhamnella rubrinervis]|uniref:Uncharacterized protein n=1 Tax=Rhamnella rubrinervis TaxID=2594499 RepID=A0A8K0HGN0_9ROSA|nr:hypothetical protein FNV43_RR02850 [Rhamnella rubrinervis]
MGIRRFDKPRKNYHRLVLTLKRPALPNIDAKEWRFHMEGVEGNEEEASNDSLVPQLALSCFPELNRIALIRQKKDAIYQFYMRLWSTKGSLSFLMTILNSICKTSRLTRRNSSYLSASSSKKGLAPYIHSCASSESFFPHGESYAPAVVVNCQFHD